MEHVWYIPQSTQSWDISYDKLKGTEEYGDKDANPNEAWGKKFEFTSTSKLRLESVDKSYILEVSAYDGKLEEKKEELLKEMYIIMQTSGVNVFI